jgi:hypothetical protein
MFSKRIVSSIVIFVFCMLLICINKPTFIFNSDGTIKEFGTGHNKSIYSLGVVSSLIAILSFYIFSLLDLIYS